MSRMNRIGVSRDLVGKRMGEEEEEEEEGRGRTTRRRG